MGAALLPAKRLRELEMKLGALQEEVEICLEIENKDTGEKDRIGGVWSNVRRAYVAPLPPAARGRRVGRAYGRQYEILHDLIRRYQQNNEATIPTMDAILTAGRRAGKSAIAGLFVALLCVLYPGCAVMIVGQRKKHGRKIIEAIRRLLKPGVLHYDRDNVKLVFANHSYIETAAADLAGNYSIGDKYHVVVYDEGAAMKPEVYDYMSPSVVDWNGLNLIPTTQRGCGWVYEKIRQAKDPDENRSRPIVVYEMSALENTFLSEAARRRLEQLRHTLSARAFASEVLGQALPEGGLALPDWSSDGWPAGNVVIPGEIPADQNSTGALSAYLFCVNRKRVSEYTRRRAWVGIDFNSAHPNWGIVWQFDEIGAPTAIGEYQQMGSTEQFGRGLADYLDREFDMGIDDVILIPDMSGSWQSASGKRSARINPSWAALQAQGWLVQAPNVGGKNANPFRWQRLEVLRTLCLTSTGTRHLHVASNCTSLIKAFEELDMDAKKFVANVQSQHVHIYDAATYPLFRLWGTSAGLRHYKQSLVTLLDDDRGQAENEVA